MSEGVVTVQDTPKRRAWIPWSVRAGVGLGLGAVIVMRDIGTYGFEREGPWSLGEPMSTAVMVVGVIMATPFVVAEGYFARRARLVWLQGLLAAAGAAVIAWFATLMVALRFCCGTNPVTQQDVETVLSSMLLMAATHSLVTVLCRSTFRRRRRA